MADYRRSYWKTIVMGLGAGLLAGLFVGGGLGLALTRGASWPWFAWVACALLLLPALLIVLFGGLTAVGGVIAIRRDVLQASGRPFAARRPREWQAGAVVTVLRRCARTIRGWFGRTPGRLRLRPGESVTVRPLAEILATLDENGRLQGLPFMPEMAASCGHSYRVLRRVDKINDYVARTGLRRMHDAVLLEQVRCSGTAHGGCQASCHVVWKEAWLERTGEPSPPSRQLPVIDAGTLDARTTRLAEDGNARYVCQMTEVATGTRPIGWLDPRHWLRDLFTGNVRPGPFFTGVALNTFVAVQHARGGLRYPHRAHITARTTPTAALNLQPGERVRVKSLAEIEQTLNYDSRNRGLWFDRDMIRHCGQEYRVLARLNRIINERTGQLAELATPIILLEDVTATGEYLAFCPQNDAIFWREIWLERLGAT